MDEKLLITIGILVVIVALLGIIYIAYVYKPAVPTEERLSDKFSEFRTQCEEKKMQGYEVTVAEAFVKKAKYSFDRKDYIMAEKFLDRAFEALKKAEISIVPISIIEGPIYETHPYYYPNHSFKEITQQIPQLADLGVKTIWLLPIWEHAGDEPQHRFIYAINV